jgi:type I restriction-modification system DNA methylase subunit
MAIKKSELYRSLWSSCDELRGGMDASQYKDYVLTLLFVKYVSDKYAGKPHALIEVPEGGNQTPLAHEEWVTSDEAETPMCVQNSTAGTAS